MTKTEMKKICKPLNIGVGEKWVDGFLVTETDGDFSKLQKLGFIVKGIGVGYDYNAKVSTAYAYKEK